MVASRVGSSWVALPNPPAGYVTDFAVFDDGMGPRLHMSGSGILGTVAKWDGTTWTLIGSLFIPGFVAGYASSIEVYDDGSGPASYAAGTFGAANAVPVTGVAKWDGTTWSAVQGGISGVVERLTVHQESTGPVLIAGGSFFIVGGIMVNDIALRRDVLVFRRSGFQRCRLGARELR
jgi:hypothetical protein